MIAFAYLSLYILNALELPYENEGYKPHLLTSILFAEYYKMMITNSFPDGAPLRVMWSLCVEEHFYMIWGVLLYFISYKKILISLYYISKYFESSVFLFWLGSHGYFYSFRLFCLWSNSSLFIDASETLHDFY